MIDQIAKVLPLKGENIIAGVMYRRHFEWYVAPKNLWKMDYKKLYMIWRFAYSKSGKTVSELENDIGSYEQFCAKRWGIEVLDSNTVSFFLAHLFKCRYSVDELRLLRMVSRDDRKTDYTPSLFIDFDNNIMYSQYPRPENFENFVPDGWTGYYENFISFIPEDKRY
ncbi:hypothetical protein [uncultured Ruminococcus sp.]|uniref:hypothetical protein n=1 Tax=uncultured Ruminococcus sp. TaxID=165186 RepID=UPI0025FEF990|nr:hypothetical protein [uncultured Ruminococcus sp.]